MTFCNTKQRTQDEKSKIKANNKFSVILPVIITILATQHWLPGFLFLMLGGSDNEFTSMSTQDIFPFQRVMIVLTLVAVLWSVFQMLKDGMKEKSMVVMTVTSSLIGMTYVIVTLVNNGW